jgi:hypothetical protein
MALRRRRLPFVSLVAVAVAAAAAALGACEDASSYVYTAQKYDPAGDCRGAYAPVEVVNGPGASATCQAICMTVGADLYVSTMCPPLPAVATEVAADAAACVAALAAEACDDPGEGGVGAGEEAGGEDAEADGATADDAAPDDGGVATDAADASRPLDAGDAG